MSNIKVKICGITDKETLENLIKYSCDYIGFVFFEYSPRNISLSDAYDFIKYIKKNSQAKIAAVVVNPDDELVSNLCRAGFDYIQFHGDESVEMLEDIKEKYDISIIKAFKIRNADDIAIAESYKDVADMYLFDAKAPKDSIMPGGNGLSFDWHLLSDRKFSKPWFLSGGLNIGNVNEAVRVSGASMVDVSSSVESSPGKKDIVMIEKFIENAKGFI